MSVQVILESEPNNFPAGEQHVQLSKRILWKYKSDDELLQLVTLANEYEIEVLDVPYFPHSRMDRSVGNSLNTLKSVCNIINSTCIKRIRTLDIHSTVTSDLLSAELENEMPVWDTENCYTVAPDAGCITAGRIENPDFIFSKTRDPISGNVTGLKCKLEPSAMFNESPIVVIDDICDGGRTFVEIAKKLRDMGYKNELRLMVSHGIFSKGKEELSKYYNIIEARNTL